MKTVAAILKEQGHAFVKKKIDHYHDECHVVNGKRAKGIPVYSKSPMDLFSKDGKWVEKLDQLVAAFRREGYKVNKYREVILKETSRSVEKLVFERVEYPTHSRKKNLDPGYLTVYVNPIKIKVTKDEE
jgi:hypothetical protein